MGLAPSPDASSTQDMGSLWSTSVESMRESTGFRVRSADFEALRWFVLPRECLPGSLPADGGYGVSHGAGNPVVSRMLASAPAPSVLDIRGTEEDGE